MVTCRFFGVLLLWSCGQTTVRSKWKVANGRAEEYHETYTAIYIVSSRPAMKPIKKKENETLIVCRLINHTVCYALVFPNVQPSQ